MSRTRKPQTPSTGLLLSDAGFSFDRRALSTIRRRLLAWFDGNRRDLPWRDDRDAYRIWISEVMLQQTQVATVIPYFERFLRSFPTLSDLARADEQQVLRLWEGLGYYRRARDLHRSAKLLLANHNGELPDDPAVWRELPGVGRYILGAVLSQAFDRRLPIVEANSKRVLCRLFGQGGDPTRRPVSDWLWQTAESLLPGKRVGDFNQAIMELGALVCTPTSPRCDECPLAKGCVAFREGKQQSLPAKAASPPIEAVQEVAVVVRKVSKVLLLRRPATGRWANMWEFPHIRLHEKEAEEVGAQRILSEMLSIRAEMGRELLTIHHSVTRFRIRLVAFEAKFQSGKIQPAYHEEGRWLSSAELADYPVSSPQRLLAKEVAATVGPS